MKKLPKYVCALLIGMFSCNNEGPQGEQGLMGTTGAQGEQGAMGTMGVAGKSQLYPAGIRLDIVNKVDYYPTEYGLTLSSIDTSVQANLPGAFDDAMCSSPNSRIGNKAWVGIFETTQGPLSGTLVSNLKSITFTARKEDGMISSSYINLLIDCDGDGIWNKKYNPDMSEDKANSDTIVVVSPTSSTFDLQDQFTTITINASDMMLRSVGGRCGLNEHPAGGGRSLNDLVAAHPNAKFIAAIPQDCGMPKNRTMSPILLIQGDSGTNQVLRTTLKEIKLKIGNQEHHYNFTSN